MAVAHDAAAVAGEMEVDGPAVAREGGWNFSESGMVEKVRVEKRFARVVEPVADSPQRLLCLRGEIAVRHGTDV